MRALKIGENINFLKMEYIFFLLLYRDVAAGLALFIRDKINMAFFFHLFPDIFGRVHPEPCLMELNVNRGNKALLFYERMGMRKLREGDFPIGNGYYMNDYIMGLDI